MPFLSSRLQRETISILILLEIVLIKQTFTICEHLSVGSKLSGCTGLKLVAS